MLWITYVLAGGCFDTEQDRRCARKGETTGWQEGWVAVCPNANLKQKMELAIRCKDRSCKMIVAADISRQNTGSAV
jgi:hypothetical protein